MTLFSLLSAKQRIFLLCPAIFCSLLAGGVAPFMTYVVGKVFDAFAKYPAQDPRLLKSIGLSALELLALGVGSLVLATLTSFLWITTAELNVLSLRKRVYQSVLSKQTAWFQDDNVASSLMSNFAKETDDIRAATSLASGLLIQYLTTTVASLLLAFLRSYSLTLVILSAVPLLIIVQSISQAFASPLLAHERSQTSKAANLVDTALAAIDTVKAFNAQHIEHDRVKTAFTNLKYASRKLTGMWGLTSACAQFVTMAMFVQAFWFGAKLVREGKNTPGDIMAVFWACLIATSNLQMCIPKWIVFTKGKFAMTNLLALLDENNQPQIESPPSSPTSPKRSQTLRKITPQRCLGELALHDVTFSYPSSTSSPSEPPILSSLSLFLPAHELTFIVGSSGSGKSTVAQLLLGMYSPNPESGYLTLDEQDLRYLDTKWIRENVMLIGQGVGGGGCVIVEGRTVFENIALAASADVKSVSREQVEEACRAALLHEFVIDLPEGYDTVLGAAGGAGGVQLSGGQKQRLMIARARIRNPPVLVLDEATSALDPTSRLLIFSALKYWRVNRTTIVITHDLTQIESENFVYVLKGGRVVEQGFRGDLERVPDDLHEEGKGEFRRMAEIQRGDVEEPTREMPDEETENITDEDNEITTDDDDNYDDDEQKPKSSIQATLKHQSILLVSLRPLTFGNWMFDVVAELTRASPAVVSTTTTDNASSVGPAFPEPAQKRETLTGRVSRQLGFGPKAVLHPLPPLRLDLQERKRRPSSAMIPPSPLTLASPTSRRFSLPPVTPTSATYTIGNRDTITSEGWNEVDLKGGWWHEKPRDDDDDDEEEEEAEEFEKEKKAVTRSGTVVHERRRRDGSRRVVVGTEVVNIKVENEEDEPKEVDPYPSFWKITAQTYPTLPAKPILFFSLLLCTLSGLMTPVFSYILSRLLVEVSLGGTRIPFINLYGGICLVIAALDGVFLGSKYFAMEGIGMAWITKLRERALHAVMSQDKTFFDQPKNSPQRLVQTLIKDADDAKNLVSVVYGQIFVVTTMLGVGLIWALVLGWQLTLAGVAIAPIFAFVMALQTRWVSLAEARNKRAKEDVAACYYDSIRNVKPVRAIGGSGLSQAFWQRFEDAADRAMKEGVKGALVEGCTYGVSSGLIYLAEAGLFYVGAVLISKGIFTYLQMVTVLNLVVFSVTLGAQLMAFTEKIAKSVQATSDLLKLVQVPTDNNCESKGSLKPDTLSIPITFKHVSFSYPSRPTVPVLRDFNLRIEPGECVAIVGTSGCGKSTVAGLLERLYEPNGGEIVLGDGDRLSLADVDVTWLRNRVAIVSQSPTLFDASVAENIRYGSNSSTTSSEGVISDIDIRKAAKCANVHEFVMSLKDGYDTHIGENASMLSGGQAQRVQIARALARMRRRPEGADVLILDEGTSALDGENESVILDAVRGLLKGDGDGDDRGRPTVLMITHKPEVMMICDRIVLVGDGRVVEEGRYDELMERKGEFARLATGGEWTG